MVKELKQGILFTLVTMVLLGGGYHVVAVGASAGSAFPAQAEGSLIRRADGTVVGSRLIAQKFTRPEYFQPRPSGVDYNAASTGGTNYGPSNPDHLKAVQERLDAVTKQEGVDGRPGAVGDGDGQRRRAWIRTFRRPRRSCRRARVAAARGVPVERVRELIRGAHRAADVRISRPGARQRARAEPGARRDARGADAGRGPVDRNDSHVRTRTHDFDLGSRASSGRRSLDSFRKLDPRIQIKNPVMFIVEVGSLLTTIIFVQELVARQRAAAVHRPGRVLALVHRAVRQLRRGDGRGPRQGAGRHAAQDAHRDRGQPADGRRPRRDGAGGEPAQGRRGHGRGRRVHSRRRRDHRGRGVSVDESAITGESAPVIRESGGDRSAVTGGTRVLSDWIKVRDHVEPGRDVPRPHDRARRGRRAAEDAERDRAEHPAGGADAGVPARRRDAAAVRVLRRHRRSRFRC